MQTTAIGTVANSLPENEVILLTLLISKGYILFAELVNNKLLLFRRKDIKMKRLPKYTPAEVRNDPYGFTYKEMSEVIGENEAKALYEELYKQLLEKPCDFDPFGQTGLSPFGYNMIDPLKSWCWGSILFYPFKISRFS